jgi:hypothetical protein
VLLLDGRFQPDPRFRATRRELRLIRRVGIDRYHEQEDTA